MNYFWPGSVNTHWGPGGPGPVNTNLGPGPGSGPRAKQRAGGREIQIPDLGTLRRSRSQIFFKIRVLKKFALFHYSQVNTCVGVSF